MKPSSTTHPISAHLAHRMGPLAVLIGVMISVLAPAIYHITESRALRTTANQHAQHFSEQLRDIIVDNPKLWKYQAQKYLELLNSFVPNKGIVAIHVKDQNAAPITQYDYRCPEETSPLWENLIQSGQAKIMFNNRVFGKVEVELAAHQVLQRCLIFFLPSVMLGVGIALFAYLFPVRVVRKVEQHNQELMEALQQLNHELELRVQARTDDLSQANAALQRQVRARKKSQAALAEARNQLEQRVAARTAELTSANRHLVKEVSNRILAEEALRASKERLALLSSKLLIVQEEERKRIAMEIHDSLATTLSAIKFSLEKTRRDMQRGEAEAQSLNSQIDTIQLTIDESRRIMSGLHPSTLDELGIVSTLEWFCNDFQERYDHIRLQARIKIPESEIPDPIKVVIFRLAQEAFHNVAGHSGATSVDLTLARTHDGIEFRVADNGQGFDLHATDRIAVPAKGLGILSMRERCENSGGTFSIETSQGKGTIVRAHWPHRLTDSEHAA